LTHSFSDDVYKVLFLNAFRASTSTSRILRINMNDDNFDTFGVLSLSTSVNTGTLDVRNGKFQLMYVNSNGDTVTSIRSACKWISSYNTTCYVTQRYLD